LYKKMPILRKGALYLTVICRTDAYDFYYGYTEGECTLLQSDIKASLLSSYTNKGFTGVYIGVYATANGKSSISKAYFDWFLYETL
jgi:xylan 1,4-beta-xylosidase